MLLGLGTAEALPPTLNAEDLPPGRHEATLDLVAAAEAPLRLVVHSETSSARGGFSAPEHAALGAAAKGLGLQPQRDIPGVGAVTYAADSEAQLNEAALVLREHPGVAVVERDATIAATTTPNDSYWEYQWGPRRISSPSAWSISTGSAGVSIAVLDTGVDPDHPDLAGNLSTTSGANFTSEGTPSDTSDLNGHGTSAAGVAAAVSDNARGIAGSCWSCEIMPVKVLDKEGVGTVSDVAAGMIHAVGAGADVLTLSMGSLADLQVMRDAVDYAITRDVAIVASAGNFGNADGTAGQERVYPAAYRDVLGVAASDERDDRYESSSFGDWVSVAAPGCNVATDLVTRQPSYRWFCGTSSSAPLVAGVVGLALASEPGASPARLSAAITGTSDALDYVAAGRVDAAAALAALAGSGEPEPDDEPLPLPDDGSEQALTLHRVAGADRYETAVRLSMQAYGPGVERVFLSTGTAFADALAGGAVAGRDRAPVLLTRPATLPDDTRDELERLAPDEIVVLGGPAAVSAEVEAAAGAAGAAPTRRVAGADRYDTASRLARHSFDSPVPVAYIATGVGFADALAGVPAAVTGGGPMLLTAPQSLPTATRDALEQLQPQRIVVLGGTSAVSADVAAELAQLTDGRVTRIAGANRYETAARVSSQTVAAGAADVYLATGLDFPDALAAGPLAGQSAGPVLLVTLDTLPSPTRDELGRIQPSTNITLGGTAVISLETEAAAGEASTPAD